MISRRRLLQAGAALPLAPRPARAAAGCDLRFVFVIAYLGWDPTRVFYPAFENPAVSTEVAATTRSAAGLTWVHHDERPSVTRFFETWADRALIVNGIRVSSLSHTICLKRMLCGSQDAAAPDWATILAAEAADRYPLPSVVVRGPSFAGRHASVVCRVGVNGQVAPLLDGTLFAGGDVPVGALSPASRGALDRYRLGESARRVTGTLDARARELAMADTSARERAATLEAEAGRIAWGTDTDLPSQIPVARDLLALGLARCVTLAHERIEWDSHQYNDDRQMVNFENLFEHLEALMEELACTPGPDGAALSESTALVVLSEMGRGPNLNAGLGKDHWPYTSALVVGPGVTGGRVVGGYDSYYYGEALDLETAEVDPGGRALDPSVFGATLLRLGGVDPGRWLRDPSALSGVLAT